MVQFQVLPTSCRIFDRRRRGVESPGGIDEFTRTSICLLLVAQEVIWCLLASVPQEVCLQLLLALVPQEVRLLLMLTLGLARWPIVFVGTALCRSRSPIVFVGIPLGLSRSHPIVFLGVYRPRPSANMRPGWAVPPADEAGKAETQEERRPTRSSAKGPFPSNSFELSRDAANAKVRETIALVD